MIFRRFEPLHKETLDVCEPYDHEIWDRYKWERLGMVPWLLEDLDTYTSLLIRNLSISTDSKFEKYCRSVKIVPR